MNVELRSVRQTSALDLFPVSLGLGQLVGDRYRHGNVALVLVVLLGMRSPAFNRQSWLCLLEGFQQTQILLINLLDLCFASREVECPRSSRHRHKHTSLSHPTVLMLAADDAIFMDVILVKCSLFGVYIDDFLRAVFHGALSLSVAGRDRVGIVTASRDRRVVEEVGSSVLLVDELERFLCICLTALLVGASATRIDLVRLWEERGRWYSEQSLILIAPPLENLHHPPQ